MTKKWNYVLLIHGLTRNFELRTQTSRRPLLGQVSIFMKEVEWVFTIWLEGDVVGFLFLTFRNRSSVFRRYIFPKLGCQFLPFFPETEACKEKGFADAEEGLIQILVIIFFHEALSWLGSIPSRLRKRGWQFIFDMSSIARGGKEFKFFDDLGANAS